MFSLFLIYLIVQKYSVGTSKRKLSDRIVENPDRTVEFPDEQKKRLNNKSLSIL